jgi:hypothetical protein
VLACFAAGVLLGIQSLPQGSHVLGDYESPGQILISADQRTLAGTVTNSCAAATLEVQETAAAVTVRLHEWQAGVSIQGVCAIESFTATLTAPLGSRPLIDGVTHVKISSFDGAGIKRPTVLPAGFVHRYDTASFGSDTVTHSSAGCVQVYTQGDSYDEAIWITQDLGGVWMPPTGVTSAPITVRGNPGTAVPGEIEWTEQGQLFTIRSATYAYATLGTQELLAIANSLH